MYFPVSEKPRRRDAELERLVMAGYATITCPHCGKTQGIEDMIRDAYGTYVCTCGTRLLGEVV